VRPEQNAALLQERRPSGEQRYLHPHSHHSPTLNTDHTLPDPYKQLKASLTRLVNEHPPASIRPSGGLYKGPVSVAYTFLILQQMYNDLEIEGQLLGTWSAAYLKQAQDTIGDYPGPKPGKCGITDDILALLAIGAATSKDVDMVSNLCDYSAEVLDMDTDNEFLYGRAGYLYLLRLVKASFIDDPKTLQLITDTQDDVVDAILDTPRPWKWHGKTYVGAIHGAIGIITQVVLTDAKKYASKVEADLAVLLTYQYETGNWPSSIPPEKDRLVQVCHGAPGVVNSLVSIKKYFPNLEEKLNRAILKGRECVKERGLLTKEPSLCHGMSFAYYVPVLRYTKLILQQASPAMLLPSRTKISNTSSPTPQATK